MHNSCVRNSNYGKLNFNKRMKTILICRHILRCHVKRKYCKKLYFLFVSDCIFCPMMFYNRNSTKLFLCYLQTISSPWDASEKCRGLTTDVFPYIFNLMLLLIFVLIMYNYGQNFKHNLTAVRRYLLYETIGNCNHFKDFHHLCEINLSELWSWHG